MKQNTVGLPDRLHLMNLMNVVYSDDDDVMMMVHFVHHLAHQHLMNLLHFVHLAHLHLMNRLHFVHHLPAQSFQCYLWGWVATYYVFFGGTCFPWLLHNIQVQLEEFVVKSDEFENKPVESGKSDKSVLLIECDDFCKLGAPVGACNSRQQGLLSSLRVCKYEWNDID